MIASSRCSSAARSAKAKNAAFDVVVAAAPQWHHDRRATAALRPVKVETRLPVVSPRRVVGFEPVKNKPTRSEGPFNVAAQHPASLSLHVGGPLHGSKVSSGDPQRSRYVDRLRRRVLRDARATRRTCRAARDKSESAGGGPDGRREREPLRQGDA